MLLMEVEKQIRKLSKSDKEQLIRDVQEWLKAETEPEPDMYPAVDVNEIAGETADWKLHPDFDWDEMYDAAEKLQAVKATLTRPTDFNESRMTFIDV